MLVDFKVILVHATTNTNLALSPARDCPLPVLVPIPCCPVGFFPTRYRRRLDKVNSDLDLGTGNLPCPRSYTVTLAESVACGIRTRGISEGEAKLFVMEPIIFLLWALSLADTALREMLWSRLAIVVFSLLVHIFVVLIVLIHKFRVVTEICTCTCILSPKSPNYWIHSIHSLFVIYTSTTVNPINSLIQSLLHKR